MAKQSKQNLHTVARISTSDNSTVYRREYSEPCEAQAIEDMLAVYPLPDVYASALRDDFSVNYGELLFEILVYRPEDNN
jgi:hypothetical protein